MKFNPYPYQQYCIDNVIFNRAIALLLDCGLGKTVITLTAIHELRYNRWEVSKPLIIAPKKVAEATWTTEAKKWEHLKMLRVVPILGSVQQRLRALATPADVYVINRENIRNGLSSISKMLGPSIWLFSTKVQVSKTVGVNDLRHCVLFAAELKESLNLQVHLQATGLKIYGRKFIF